MDDTVMVTLPNGDAIAACALHLRVTCKTCDVGMTSGPLLPYVVKRPARHLVLDRRLDEYNALANLSDSHLPMTFENPKRHTSDPLELFTPINNRFVNNNNPFEILIFTDGACSSNGTQEAAGGCSFSYADGITVKFRLENRGPDDNHHRPTSNRAELRAVLAALKFCHWEGDGSKSVVIATDSTYVVKGATEWSRTWTENGWRGRAG
ncbi:RNase H domain-containing protein [Colletotrichum sojae]|uniref:ribonuclease H n=1 Tax=Colletotrichum sojae TaxID=2175907 RepID=A0A8H6JSD6_9PEZI|nr:RNase H domain-containing protein [Colletotrichum sojae]